MQSIADSHQRAAHYLSEQIQYTEKANASEQPKEKVLYQKMAAQSSVKATKMIEAAHNPLQARFAKEKQDLLKTAARFATEPETTNGRSSYANNAIKQGVPIPLVRAFESYRNKAVQAYHDEKKELSAHWAKIAEDTQESIEYHIKAFQNVHDNNLFHCYIGSANAMHEYAQSQAEFLTTHQILPQSHELMTLGQQVEHYFCEAVDTYDRAIQVFQKGDRKVGAALQEVASRQRKTAHYLEKYIACKMKEHPINEGASAQEKAQKTADDIQTQVYWKLSINMLQGQRKVLHALAKED